VTALAGGRRDKGAWPGSVALLTEVCRLAHNRSFENDLRNRLRAGGIVTAVRRHDTARLFDWLMAVAVYQGVSDRAAAAYAAAHGTVRHGDVAESLAALGQPCPKLAGFDALTGCGYRKVAQTCAHPELLPDCPLPRPDLRNGRLNQAAYSLFFFLRDVCDGDLVAWLDRQLGLADDSDHPDRLARLRAAVLPSFCGIVGIGQKVGCMLLADLLIGGDPARERWVACGRSLVVVDSLVHAFLHRTGILARHDADHRYGPGCYHPDGCADLLERLARAIDVRQFVGSLPAYHPRFVQHAVWRFCGADGLDICNGHRIDDRDRCANQACGLYDACGRVALRPPMATEPEIPGSAR
jgi:hypothetical protein